MFFRSLSILANRDWCPWANRYVYWLKEPVGWFVVATAVSILVGAFLSPLGWTVAAGLVAIIALGLGFPWLAIRTLSCELRSARTDLHEQDASQFELIVRNRLPFPVLGLMIEGYLSWPSDETQESGDVDRPIIGLARVPPLSSASYHLPICPEYRGRYPIQVPTIACSFPFGIWTARGKVRKVVPVTVWPLLIPVSGEIEIAGSKLADVGRGERPSTQGDFLGVRDFRSGDSLRSIHWAQSARNDRLIVCERGGPQKQAIELHLSTLPCEGNAIERRENLAWRVRIAASLVDLLVSRHLPFRLYVDGILQSLPDGVNGRSRAWDLLSDIPIVGLAGKSEPRSVSGAFSSGSSSFVISATETKGDPLAAQWVRLDIKQPSIGIRSMATGQSYLFDLDIDIAAQLNDALMEANHVCSAC